MFQKTDTSQEIFKSRTSHARGIVFIVAGHYIRCFGKGYLSPVTFLRTLNRYSQKIANMWRTPYSAESFNCKDNE